MYTQQFDASADYDAAGIRSWVEHLAAISPAQLDDDSDSDDGCAVACDPLDVDYAFHAPPQQSPADDSRWRRECRVCGQKCADFGELVDHLKERQHWNDMFDGIPEEPESEPDLYDYDDAGCGDDCGWTDAAAEISTSSECTSWEALAGPTRRHSWSGHESLLERVDEEEDDEYDDDDAFPPATLSAPHSPRSSDTTLPVQPAAAVDPPQQRPYTSPHIISVTHSITTTTTPLHSADPRWTLRSLFHRRQPQKKVSLVPTAKITHDRSRGRGRKWRARDGC